MRTDAGLCSGEQGGSFRREEMLKGLGVRTEQSFQGVGPPLGADPASTWGSFTVTEVLSLPSCHSHAGDAGQTWAFMVPPWSGGCSD